MSSPPCIFQAATPTPKADLHGRSLIGSCEKSFFREQQAVPQTIAVKTPLNTFYAFCDCISSCLGSAQWGHPSCFVSHLPVCWWCLALCPCLLSPSLESPDPLLMALLLPCVWVGLWNVSGGCSFQGLSSAEAHYQVAHRRFVSVTGVGLECRCQCGRWPVCLRMKEAWKLREGRCHLVLGNQTCSKLGFCCCLSLGNLGQKETPPFFLIYISLTILRMVRIFKAPLISSKSSCMQKE